MHFLYTRVNGRLCPSIRHQTAINPQGKDLDANAVFKVEIDVIRPLNELMKMYPMGNEND